MATSPSSFPILSLLVLLAACTLHTNGCYTSVISFGDSLTDTGNLKHLYLDLNIPPSHSFYLPFGETFFHEATGRCSDGRLIIDFIAEGFGLPLIPSYMDLKTNSVVDNGQGVNFAVSGATVLDSSFYEAHGIFDPYTKLSLGVQLQWFKEWLTSMYRTSSDKKNILQNTVIVMGEIGGNDYNHALSLGKPFEELYPNVHLVVNVIASTINDLIELGGETLVVPGNLPIGCLPGYLTQYYGSDNVTYDNTTGCIIELNKLTEYHNGLLQTALNRIRETHPNINIIYADYYNAALQFYRSPEQYGFRSKALRACCGGGGPYNFDELIMCGDPLATTCTDPYQFPNWDGLHLTEAAYEVMYKSLFHGAYTTPQFNSLCPKSVVHGRDALSKFV